MIPRLAKPKRYQTSPYKPDLSPILEGEVKNNFTETHSGKGYEERQKDKKETETKKELAKEPPLAFNRTLSMTSAEMSKALEQELSPGSTPSASPNDSTSETLENPKNNCCTVS